MLYLRKTFPSEYNRRLVWGIYWSRFPSNLLTLRNAFMLIGPKYITFLSFVCFRIKVFFKSKPPTVTKSIEVDTTGCYVWCSTYSQDGCFFGNNKETKFSIFFLHVFGFFWHWHGFWTLLIFRKAITRIFNINRDKDQMCQHLSFKNQLI